MYLILNGIFLRMCLEKRIMYKTNKVYNKQILLSINQIKSTKMKYIYVKVPSTFFLEINID